MYACPSSIKRNNPQKSIMLRSFDQVVELARQKGPKRMVVMKAEEGAFTPERAGSLPTTELLELAFSGRYTREEIGRKLVGEGGLMAYLGTNDSRTVEERIAQGDGKAKLIYEALAYQVAKEIGALSTVLKGKVDAVVITGRLAYSRMLVEWIKERVSFIGPLLWYPGEDELQTLALRGLGALKGEGRVLDYPTD